MTQLFVENPRGEDSTRFVTASWDATMHVFDLTRKELDKSPGGNRLPAPPKKRVGNFPMGVGWKGVFWGNLEFELDCQLEYFDLAVNLD